MSLRRRRERRHERAKEAAVRAFDAADGRLPLAEPARAVLHKAFPDHWSFLLGELALYAFLVLLLTGVYLTLFFDPSMVESTYTGPYEPLQGQLMTQAYTTTLRISFRGARRPADPSGAPLDGAAPTAAAVTAAGRGALRLRRAP
ncbi:hypothetical protein [Streptomyces litmocidini]|uniref:hypothetical protein n=1 Tax=Streptomyces litmocidini TaxID=67318 RepID=UPI0036F60E03